MRLSVLWGEKLLEVRQVSDTTGITAGMLFGESVAATGLAPETKLFDDGGVLQSFGTVNLGPLTLCAEDIIPAQRVSTIAPPDDYSFFKIATITALTFAAVLVSIAITPRDYQDAADAFMHQDIVRIVKTMPPRVIDLSDKVAAAAPAAPDEEGRAGPKDKPKKDKVSIAEKQGRTTEQLKKSIQDVGIVGAMNQLGQSSVFAPNNDARLTVAMNNLRPNNVIGDVSGGEHGMGVHHSGGGGGDKNGLSMGDVGTIGGHVPGGTGNRLSFSNGPRHQVVPDGGKNVRIIGGLSKEVIAKEIRKHQSEIRYCYETALQHSPELAGKVAVLFTIDPAGDISDADLAETTLNNESAEQCMLSKIRRWKFPAPEGGGVVTVTFPWVFSSAGSNPENE
ncbi:MAG: AgmX/PglI C-terminal domain-containing protein [Myxococcaceae bacterium]